MSAKLRKIKAMAESPPPPGWALLIAIVVGSGGTAALLPKMAPSWYRPDPATGEELRILRSRVDEFLKEGPLEVRMQLTEINLKLDQIVSELHQRGQEHSAEHQRWRHGKLDR